MVVTPLPVAATEATLVAACQLLNNLPAPDASPLAAEQWRHNVDYLIVAAIDTPHHGGRKQLSVAHSHMPTVAHVSSVVFA
jgi:hypothetical protein